ncbi:MAG: hypothetical protein B7Z29_21190 [Hyphomicrobium sp. 12-62-95]|nr:MAG: hypothetical protein B7Z29_21190 [Hyphomicrobium sp. 12-62-95]
MTRLTNDIRGAIHKAAVTAAFAEREAAMKAAEAALAVEAYEATFSEDVLALVAKVPANWFRKDRCLNFNVGGLRIRLNTSDYGLPVPYQSAGGRGYGCHEEIGTVMPGDLCDRIQAHAKAKEALRDQYKRAEKDLEMLLLSISTVNKLKEVWPEGEPFYSRFLDTRAPSLPAIRFAEVNKVLGLEPKSA